VRGAFATRPGIQVDNLRVLLVDDVLTQGATRHACARALREAGAKSVIGLTVARAVRTRCQTPESGKIPEEGAVGANRHMSVDSRGRYTPEVAGRGYARFRGPAGSRPYNLNSARTSR